MYKLLRRISSSFTGRIDRTREEQDASPSTPSAGSKRRMSDDDDEQNGSLSKRSRGHDDTTSRPDEFGSAVATPARDESESPASSSVPASGLTRKDTEEVRQVTKGVKEVELEDKKGKGVEAVQETPEDKVNDGPTPEVTEDATPDEPPKVDDATEDETVADADAGGDASDAEGSVVSDSEPTNDESEEPIPVKESTSESTEVPSESKASKEEPVRVDNGPISDVKSTKATDLDARVRDTEIVAGPISSGTSGEIPAKA
ncbi:uncharacterized protein FOMMEDRAFT_20788 [Fomitiporia mediterranea MF3/22]|uniref:uncharacterized protein n=1 Tax=Fomitiporia mediterranea (strain MF3/22) TaxID=694068 RepID=UPI0004407854|nr:uncharacterized protein FOMMEDRAFT_20788 [Fomitiporia mediterranea MF3/22]EJD02026.1 hypothetical protein FOMMEDRAFT_20788 [Fomitiporia mediterranea MF3/22]